mmetsp:Transcript_11332/g.12657  ORF Transcript_11332/g.12657 Transcript_11332/m.12657 type:complete len:676 (+) Transcript_11332:92-2119(+)
MSHHAQPAATPVDDSDLDDLLQHKVGDGGIEEAPLDLDHLTKGQLDVPHRSSSSPGIGDLISTHCRFLCYMYPKCCACVSVSSVALVMFFFIGILLDPTRDFGNIKNDYTAITSKYDLDLGKIDHWCLNGGDNSCRCEDPLDPRSRIEYKTWNIAHKANKKHIEVYKDSAMLDVAFLGESIVEEMDGRWMGSVEGSRLKGIEKAFKKQFKGKNSGMEGIALGIAGDTSPNVLWRLLHGEMPPEFNPRVWWVVLGMNDLGRMQCSEEVVVLGILRVVEEIRSRKPDAKIVINSMLPMVNLRGGIFPNKIDYTDAFRDKRGRPLRSSSIDPSHFGRTGGGVVGSDQPRINYKRPDMTTNVIMNRNRYKNGIASDQAGVTGRLDGSAQLGVAGKIGGSGSFGQSRISERGQSSSFDRIDRSSVINKSAQSGLSKGKGEKDRKEMEAGERTSLPAVGATGDSGAPIKNHQTKHSVREYKKNDEIDEDEDEEGDNQRRRISKHVDEDYNKEVKKIKEQIRTEKKFMKKIKRDPINPKFNLDKTKVKVRDPKHLFLKKNVLPIWTSIFAINKELQKFADKHDDISFFDATDIFAERLNGRRYVLQSNKISIRGHPTELGFVKWEEAIATKLKKMLEKDDEKLAMNLKEEEKGKQEHANPMGNSMHNHKDQTDEDDGVNGYV